MNHSTSLQPLLIASATRTGKRHLVNDDHCAAFVVLRENTTRRLARKRSAAEEETISLAEEARPANTGSLKTSPLGAPSDWETDPTQKIYIAVIADGVTNTLGGGQASQIAVDSLRANLQDPPSRQETISEWLEFAIQRANEEILFAAKQNPTRQGMSSTIALAALAGEKLYILHLGDSRAYLLRQQQIYQLTTDHTWAQESINAGAVALEEGSQQPGSNQLLRFLGAQKLSAVDRGIVSPVSDQREEYLIVEAGDVILLCSDGLYRRVNRAAITATIAAHRGYPQDAADDLIEQAVAKGEQDDITVVVLELPPARKELNEQAENISEAAFKLPKIRWLRKSLIILFALILLIVVALLVWSWRA